jgi:hypothetical protein
MRLITSRAFDEDASFNINEVKSPLDEPAAKRSGTSRRKIGGPNLKPSVEIRPEQTRRGTERGDASIRGRNCELQA